MTNTQLAAFIIGVAGLLPGRPMGATCFHRQPPDQTDAQREIVLDEPENSHAR